MFRAGHRADNLIVRINPNDGCVDRTVTPHDYNGPGRWSAEEIVRRYQAYAKRFHVSPVRNIEPDISRKGDQRWVYPVMYQIIDGIKDGDPACVQIGIEFIGEDQGFPFGAILKSNTARALRQFPGLTSGQMATIRARVVGMLLTGIVPREYREYSKLLRKIGIGDHWPRIVSATPRNHYAARAQAYFMRHCAPAEAKGT